MADIIIPSGDQYVVQDLVEITKTLAEWKGKDPNDKDWIVDPNAKDTRYQLKEVGNICLARLELVCLEPFDAGNVKHYDDRIFNKELEKLFDRALKLANVKGLPYVAFTKDLFSLPRISHHGGESRIIPTTIYGQFYREKS